MRTKNRCFRYNFTRLEVFYRPILKTSQPDGPGKGLAMSHRCLLLSLAAMLFSAALDCPPLPAQDVQGGDGKEYPQRISNFPDNPSSQIPKPRTAMARPPILPDHAQVGLSAPTYPYGYFGAQSHYRWNSHFTTSNEYMFWRPGWRHY